MLCIAEAMVYYYYYHSLHQPGILRIIAKLVAHNDTTISPMGLASFKRLGIKRVSFDVSYFVVIYRHFEHCANLWSWITILAKDDFGLTLAMVTVEVLIEEFTDCSFIIVSKK